MIETAVLEQAAEVDMEETTSPLSSFSMTLGGPARKH
jgi:hypothetical protein